MAGKKILTTDAKVIMEKFLKTDMTRKEIAAAVGLNQSTMSRIFNGDIQVGFSVARKLRNYFGENAVRVEFVQTT